MLCTRQRVWEGESVGPTEPVQGHPTVQGKGFAGLGPQIPNFKDTEYLHNHIKKKKKTLTRKGRVVWLSGLPPAAFGATIFFLCESFVSLLVNTAFPRPSKVVEQPETECRYIKPWFCFLPNINTKDQLDV